MGGWDPPRTLMIILMVLLKEYAGFVYDFGYMFAVLLYLPI